MGCVSSRCCDSVCCLFDRYWPKSRFANPRYLLAATLTTGTVAIFLRNEPAWPSNTISAIHLIGFTMTTGTALWVTMFESTLLSKALASEIELQDMVWSNYFAFLSIGAFGSLASYTLLHPINTWTESSAMLGGAFIGELLVSLVALTYLTPKCIEFLEQIKNFESDEGLNDSDQDVEQKRLEFANTSPVYKRLNRNFTVAHTGSMFCNFIVLATGFYHGHHLAQRLRVF